ncbi:DUF4041 domain-containing protein [Cryptosporangium aurantiacum]|uniref:T5orf172 domain-containing protein n=1 Tax=Cryptosporangium aurantiacum TaxID=134849 RepID=A0A1M7RLK3_9ACTN|nr:DUF4041 domain-containing protein [Cryptosporangium aurantiacum]SHN46968.1 T5orf172 domain-containing protein [Cryptosporangium aurantiacum]
MRFNPPPGWPTPPPGWTPPNGWQPDPSWPTPPPGWQLWVPEAPTAPPPSGTAPVPRPRVDQPERRPEWRPEPQAERRPEPEWRLDPRPEPAARPAETTGGRHAAPDSPADDRAALLARITELDQQLATARAGGGAVELDDQLVLQEVGIYRYHHPLEDAPAYKARLRDLNDRVKEFVKQGDAVLAADLFTFDGSLAKGRKMVKDLSRLMLRAYNAEAENCVRSLRSGNVTTAVRRLTTAVDAIEKLGVIMEMRINPEYHALRIEELELTADHQMKVQEERERAREEREALREQKRVEQELAAERERLEKERQHYRSALAALQAKGDTEAAANLAERLTQIDAAIEQNDYRAANIRAGYVYVISNVGAFGPSVVKIGMTRRVEPYDRVRELGDASVPFPFDVHILFFSDDAVSLENELHKAFAHRRLNLVNERREFFFASPAEVQEVFAEKVGGLLEFREQPEADQYFQSRGQWPPVTTGPR